MVYNYISHQIFAVEYYRNPRIETSDILLIILLVYHHYHDKQTLDGKHSEFIDHPKVICTVLIFIDEEQEVLTEDTESEETHARNETGKTGLT